MGLPLQNVQLIIITSVFMALAIFTVALRLLCRWMKRSRLVLNDYIIIAALIMLIGECGIVLNSKSIVPEGVKDSAIQAKLQAREEKTYLASDILWVSTMATIKLSFLHLYLTIFKNKIFYRFVYGVMAVNIAWWIAMFVEELTICQPLAYTWDKSIDGHCGSVDKAYVAEAIINVILDAAVIALPMPMLWNLNMRLSKKLIISGIFSLGVIVIVISILRIVALTRLDTGDLSYSSFYTDMFSVLEPCLAVVNACLPVMHPIYAKVTSIELRPLLRSTVFTRSHRSTKYSSEGQRSDDQRSSSKNTQGNETRQFNRMYDAMCPMTTNGMTQLDTQVGAGDEGGLAYDGPARVGHEADASSTGSRRNPSEEHEVRADSNV